LEASGSVHKYQDVAKSSDGNAISITNVDVYCRQIFWRMWDGLSITSAIAYVGQIAYLNGSFVSFGDLDCILACGFKVHPVLEVSEAKVSVELLVTHPLDRWRGAR
jgi:hypothetical protein